MACFTVANLELAHATMRDFPANWIDARALSCPDNVEVWQCRAERAVVAILDARDPAHVLVYIEAYTPRMKTALAWYAAPARKRRAR